MNAVNPIALRDAVIARLKTAIPMARSVAPHYGDVTLDLLKRYSADAPCLRVALTGFGEVSRQSGGGVRLPVHLAVIALTKDVAEAGKGRVPAELSAAALAAATTMAVMNASFNRWGLNGVYSPSAPRAVNETTPKVDELGMGAWQVTWSQEVLMGEDFETAIAALSQFWINGALFDTAADIGDGGADPLMTNPQAPVLVDGVSYARPLDTGDIA